MYIEPDAVFELVTRLRGEYVPGALPVPLAPDMGVDPATDALVRLIQLVGDLPELIAQQIETLAKAFDAAAIDAIVADDIGPPRGDDGPEPRPRSYHDDPISAEDDWSFA